MLSPVISGGGLVHLVQSALYLVLEAYTDYLAEAWVWLTCGYVARHTVVAVGLILEFAYGTTQVGQFQTMRFVGVSRRQHREYQSRRPESGIR